MSGHIRIRADANRDLTEQGVYLAENAGLAANRRHDWRRGKLVSLLHGGAAWSSVRAENRNQVTAVGVNQTSLPSWSGSTCLKPSQPPPRLGGHRAGGWPTAVRSEVRALPSDWRELPFRSAPGWRHQLPGIGQRTISPHATLSPRTVVSQSDSFTRRIRSVRCTVAL